MSATQPHIDKYRRGKNGARLMNRDFRLALALQRQGKTMREIAQFLNAPVKAVEQSLYWDVVR